MSNTWKIVIVVAVVLGIGVVLALKESGSPSEETVKMEMAEKMRSRRAGRTDVEVADRAAGVEEETSDSVGTENGGPAGEDVKSRRKRIRAGEHAEGSAAGAAGKTLEAGTRPGDAGEKPAKAPAPEAEESGGSAAGEGEERETREQQPEQGEADESAGSKQLPRFVEVGSETCMPCQMMQGVLDKLRGDYAGQMRVEFANLTEDAGAAETYGVQVIPTQIIFDASGEEVFRHTGFWPKEQIDQKLKELGIIG